MVRALSFNKWMNNSHSGKPRGHLISTNRALTLYSFLKSMASGWHDPAGMGDK